MHAINNTKKGATIRIALYSFDRIPVAKALIARQASAACTSSCS